MPIASTDRRAVIAPLPWRPGKWTLLVTAYSGAGHVLQDSIPTGVFETAAGARRCALRYGYTIINAREDAA